MKKWLIVIAVILVIALAVYYFIGYNKPSSQTIAVTPVNVVVAVVQQKDLPQTVYAIGSIYSKQTVTISPQINGQIKNILFKNGQAVTAGQLLYEIDDQLYQAKYAAAKADLELSRITYQRNLALIKRRMISKQAFDQTLAIYQRNQANLQASQVQLAETKITAPFSGLISASQVSVGQFVQVGDVLVNLVDNLHLVIHYSIPEDYLNQVKLGQAAQITSSAVPNKTFNATVNFVSPTIDPQTRTLPVWAELLNTEALLAPGLFVNVQQQVGVIAKAILIPQAALMPTVEGDDVFIIKNKQAYKKSVITGNTVDNQVVITQGLQANEQVVIAGQEKLANGSQVTVVTP